MLPSSWGPAPYFMPSSRKQAEEVLHKVAEKLGTGAGAKLSKHPKELSGPMPSGPRPPPEENLPEMGGNLGPCPCPQGSAARTENNVAFVPSAASEGF